MNSIANILSSSVHPIPHSCLKLSSIRVTRMSKKNTLSLYFRKTFLSLNYNWTNEILMNSFWLWLIPHDFTSTVTPWSLPSQLNILFQPCYVLFIEIVCVVNIIDIHRDVTVTQIHRDVTFADIPHDVTYTNIPYDVTLTDIFHNALIHYRYA